jgi:hypothetical protein
MIIAAIIISIFVLFCAAAYWNSQQVWTQTFVFTYDMIESEWMTGEGELRWRAVPDVDTAYITITIPGDMERID